MTPDEARADERRRIMERLETRAVSEDVCADRNAALSLPERLVGKHEYAASVLREEARAIAALGPVAPVDDALLMRVATMVRDECSDVVVDMDYAYNRIAVGKVSLAAIVERAKGGA